MKMKWRRFRLICLLALTLFIVGVASGCAGATPGARAPARPIKVGIIDAYSGPATTYTMEALDGFKLALKEVNEKGVLGTKIEFVQRDDQFKVDLALNWAKELVMRENVDLLVGTINSAAALAVSEYAKENKVPFIVWGSQSERITGEAGHRYVFSMVPNTAMSGKAGALQMAKLPYKKYWLAGSDYEFGHAIVNSFWENLKKLRPDVEKVGETWWPVGEPDFTPHINRIRAAKPEVLVVGTGGKDNLTFLKAVAATGLNKEVQIWLHTVADLSTIGPLGAEGPEGIWGTNPYFYYYPDTPENKAFVEAFRKEYNRPPAAFALYGYITGKFIAAAFEKAGAIDREKFIDALEGLSIDSPVGKITVRAYDHQVIMPMFCGITAKDPNLPHLIAKDIWVLPGEEIMPSVEDIQKKREGKK